MRRQGTVLKMILLECSQVNRLGKGRKKNGPRIDPCGTPNETDNQSEVTPSIATH